MLSDKPYETTLDDVLSWKEELAFKARALFGRNGAIVNTKTYEKLKSKCVNVPSPSRYCFMDDALMRARRLTCLQISIDDSVPDDVVRKWVAPDAVDTKQV